MANAAAPPSMSVVDRDIWEVIHLHENYLRNVATPERNIPPHIACMKSWSAAYKATVYAKERALSEAYFIKARRTEGFFDKTLRRLGLTGGDNGQ
jgi:hypothetical protein